MGKKNQRKNNCIPEQVCDRLPDRLQKKKKFFFNLLNAWRVWLTLRFLMSFEFTTSFPSRSHRSIFRGSVSVGRRLVTIYFFSICTGLVSQGARYVLEWTFAIRQPALLLVGFWKFDRRPTTQKPSHQPKRNYISHCFPSR